MDKLTHANSAGILQPPQNSFALTKWPAIKPPATINQALRIPLDQTKTIGQLLKEEPESVEFIVVGELVMFADILGGTSSVMTPAKALNIGRRFMELRELRNIRAEELAYFFNAAFSFKYGKLYGAFGWDSLAEWWRLFWDERITAAEEMSINDHLARAYEEKIGRTGEARIITPAHILKVKETGING